LPCAIPPSVAPVWPVTVERKTDASFFFECEIGLILPNASFSFYRRGRPEWGHRYVSVHHDGPTGVRWALRVLGGTGIHNFPRCAKFEVRRPERSGQEQWSNFDLHGSHRALRENTGCGIDRRIQWANLQIRPAKNGGGTLTGGRAGQAQTPAGGTPADLSGRQDHALRGRSRGWPGLWDDILAISRKSGRRSPKVIWIINPNTNFVIGGGRAV